MFQVFYEWFAPGSQSCTHHANGFYLVHFIWLETMSVFFPLWLLIKRTQLELTTLLRLPGLTGRHGA